MGAEGAWKSALRAICLAFLVVNIPALQVHATTYSVQNLAPSTPGGMRYATEVGDAWTIAMLQDVRTFIVNALSLSPVKQVDHVKFIVRDMEGIAHNINEEISVAAKWMESTTGDLKYEIKGLMFHELCHSFQNNKGNYGSDAHFKGVIEGIANYMQLAAGHGIGPKEKGGNWYAGYTTTAHFLAWIDQTQISQFVNRLNQRMGLLEWNDDFFVHITSKDVNTLWAEYQASF